MVKKTEMLDGRVMGYIEREGLYQTPSQETVKAMNDAKAGKGTLYGSVQEMINDCKKK